MPTLTERSGIEATAAAVAISRLQHIHDDNGRADMKLLVAQLGGILTEGPASLLVADRGEFTISVPAVSRYEIAHMTGHYVLHFLSPGRPGPGVYSCPGELDQERAANAFADELLMPAACFMRVLRDRHRDMSAVAEHFGVTPLAAKSRAARLHEPLVPQPIRA